MATLEEIKNGSNLDIGDSFIYDKVRYYVDSIDTHYHLSREGRKETYQMNISVVNNATIEQDTYTQFKPSNIQKNETNGSTSTISNGERTGRSVFSSTTRQTASSVRPFGNATKSTVKTTRTGRIEISAKAITT